MICVICKQAHLKEGMGTSIFERDGMTLTIKNVPRLICPNCGEEYTDEETTKRLLQIAEEAEKTGVLTDIRIYTTEYWIDPVGSLSDLPEDMFEELDHIRHANPPTPPIENFRS